MTVPESRAPAKAGAVTVVVCDGHRCQALRGRTDTGVGTGEASTLLGALRERVRRSRHAILIRSRCLGVCAQAPAVCVIRRAASQAAGGAGVLFGPVERPWQVRKLLDAVPIDGEGTAPGRDAGSAA